jgi:hypothetical protein
MKTVIYVDDRPITLQMKDFDDEVDIDMMTGIDYSNLFGEAVTVSANLNRFGILKASAEEKLSKAKLELDIYESGLRKSFRREANMNDGKFKVGDEAIKLTEGSLNEAIMLDKGLQVMKNNIIKFQKNVSDLDSIFWSISSKDKKLNNMLKAVTPSEFYNEIIEGAVNGFVIKKHKRIDEK